MINLQSSPVSVVRPIGIPGRAVGSWELSGLAGVSGSGNETVYTPYGYLIGTPPAGSGLFSIPGIELYTESGSSTTAYAELWRETGTITGTGELNEQQIGSVSASAIGLTGTGYNTYSLGNTGITTGTVGTFYSAWQVVGGTGISGFTFGIILQNSSLGATFAVPSGTMAFAGSISIQLANSGSGVISEYQLCSYQASTTRDPVLGTGPSSATVTQVSPPCLVVSAHAGNIYQCRLKMVVSSFSGNYIGGGYSATYLGFR